MLQTADRMDQKALEHYDKRMSKIDGPLAEESLDEFGGLSDDAISDAAVRAEAFPPTDSLQEVSLPDPPLSDPISEPLSPLSDGLSEPASRRLAQEDRKLQHQLDVAQHLRDVAARNGNENLLRTAERMETMAADRYQKQLEKLGLFEEFPLPDPPIGEPAI